MQFRGFFLLKRNIKLLKIDYEMTQAVLEDRSHRCLGKRAHTSSTWPYSKKQALLKEAKAGATPNNLRLKYANLPAESTMRGWISKVKCA